MIAIKTRTKKTKTTLIQNLIHYGLFALYVFSSLTVLHLFLEKLLKGKKRAAILCTIVVWLLLPSGLYFESVLLNILGVLGFSVIMFVSPVIGLVSVFIADRKLRFCTALMTLFLVVYPILSLLIREDFVDDGVEHATSPGQLVAKYD